MSDRPNQPNGKGIIADVCYQFGDRLAKRFDQIQAAENLGDQKEQVGFDRSHHNGETKQEAKVNLVLPKQ